MADQTSDNIETTTGEQERLSVSHIIDAFDAWHRDTESFCWSWDEYIAGLDTACTGRDHGVHSLSYLQNEGACEYCGRTNHRDGMLITDTSENRISTEQLLDAYEMWDGEVDTFVLAWDNYLRGIDTVCIENSTGVHSTYLGDDSSCSYCGQKNRG